jgi:hypothetical protein
MYICLKSIDFVSVSMISDWILVLFGLWSSTPHISVLPWRSVLLVEKTGVPEENHRPVASH